MRRSVWVIALLLTPGAGGRGYAGDHDCCEPAEPCWLKRLGPVGGWHPYGGGLLHWWNPHCFPCGGAPDDYCRKPLPCACWPAYPPYFTWGPPEVCHPPACPPRGCDKAQPAPAAPPR
jgi:hypothetical protein